MMRYFFVFIFFFQIIYALECRVSKYGYTIEIIKEISKTVRIGPCPRPLYTGPYSGYIDGVYYSYYSIDYIYSSCVYYDTAVLTQTYWRPAYCIPCPEGTQYDSQTDTCQDICTDDTMPDTPFPDLAENERILFEWDETDDRSAECTASPIGGRVQQALLSCQKKYRCVKESLPECPRNEPVGSYVAPTSGTLHEDIRIPGTGIQLHYASDRNETNGTLFGKWSFDIRHTLQNGYLLLGSGEKYSLSSANITDEANRTVIRILKREFLFDSSGRHLETIDALSGTRIYSFEYDNNGSLAAVMDGFGETIHLVAEENATRIEAPGGQITRIETDISGNVVKILFEDGSAFRFLYDAKGRLVEKIDPNGNRFEYLYNDSGKVIKTVDPENASWAFSQESAGTGVETVVARPSGETLRYIDRYLQNGMLTSETVYPDSHKVTRSVSLDGGRIERHSCGMKTTYLYEADGTHLLYDPWSGEPQLRNETRQTPSGLTKTIDYNLSYVTEANGSLVALSQTRTVNGKTYRYIRDFKEHNATLRTPEGRETRVLYTEDNRLPVRIDAPGLNPIFFTYDDKGRLIDRTAAYRTYRYRYDAAGNLVETIDPLGRSTRYTYDPLGRITSVLAPSGSEIRFNYDANGNMTLLTTPHDAPYAFTYDGVNLVDSETSPVDATTRYLYDAQRRLIKVTRPSGRSVEYIYSAGRLATLKTAEGEIRYGYACGDLPSKITRGDESVRYEYDGTLTTKVLFGGILDAAITYSYNDDMLPAAITYAGETTSYAYDSDDLLSRAGDLSITREFRFRNVTHYTEDGYDRYLMHNGYDEPAFSISPDYVYGLIRNKDGRISVKTEYTGGRLYLYRYAYDTEGRLVKVYMNGNETESYTYDPNGNRIEATIGGKTYTAHHTLDDRLEVYGDNTYRYDEDGYLVEKSTPQGTTTYTYDTLGALTGVTLPDGTEIRYIQNALGQRAAKEVNGTITERYLWRDLTTLLAVYDGDGNVVQRFEYADERVPFAMTMNGKRYHLHYDHLGSLRAVTDINHTIVKAVVYDAYGNIVEDSNESFAVPFGFAGGLHDRDTALVHFGYREYDPFTGRWTAKDPIGFAGGDSNLYGYVLNDPVNLVDPDGRNPLLLFLALYFALGDEYANAPTSSNDIYDGMTPMNELGLCILGGNWYRTGKEISFGKNLRIAPFGNRTGHPTGKFPHYHRRPKPNEKGQVPRGQGINRHRPWDVQPSDKSLWDRF